MAKIQGGKLMAFLFLPRLGEDVSIGFATNHTLEIGSETADTSNKDEGGGKWASTEVKKLSWTVTSENFLSFQCAGANFADLYSIMEQKKLVRVLIDEPIPDFDENMGWTPYLAQNIYSGWACISSLQLNAQNGEYATFNVTFTGVTALVPDTGYVPTPENHI